MNLPNENREETTDKADDLVIHKNDGSLKLVKAVFNIAKYVQLFQSHLITD